MRNTILIAAMAALTFLAAGCVSGDPIPGYDDIGQSGFSPVPSGATRVQPVGGWEEDAELDQPLFGPELEAREEVPFAKISQLRVHMTEEDLAALLGEPLNKEVSQYNTDTLREWNAWVWSWKYQDSRFSSVVMDRDLEVRLAYVDRRDTILGRIGVEGPTWVVTGWDLY